MKSIVSQNKESIQVFIRVLGSRMVLILRLDSSITVFLPDFALGKFNPANGSVFNVRKYTKDYKAMYFFFKNSQDVHSNTFKNYYQLRCRATFEN